MKKVKFENLCIKTELSQYENENFMLEVIAASDCIAYRIKIFDVAEVL